MEMVEMNANLAPLDSFNGGTEISQDITKIIGSLTINPDEFKPILNKTKEWNLLDKKTRTSITNALNEKAIRKIFLISSLTFSIGGAATWLVIGSGIMELYSQLEEGSISLQDVFESRTFLLYCGKLFTMMLVPYITWRNDHVKNKIGKSIMNGVPIVGSWVFPAWAMQEEEEFLKFWKVVNKVKKDHQDVLNEKNTQEERHKKELIFRKNLTTSIEKQFKPSDYRERLLNTIDAQGFDNSKIDLPLPKQRSLSKYPHSCSRSDSLFSRNKKNLPRQVFNSVPPVKTIRAQL